MDNSQLPEVNQDLRSLQIVLDSLKPARQGGPQNLFIHGVRLFK